MDVTKEGLGFRFTYKTREEALSREAEEARIKVVSEGLEEISEKRGDYESKGGLVHHPEDPIFPYHYVIAVVRVESKSPIPRHQQLSGARGPHREPGNPGKESRLYRP